MGKKKRTTHKKGSLKKTTAVSGNVNATLRKHSRFKLDLNAVTMGVEDRSAWTPLLTVLLIFLISTPSIIGPYGQKNGYTPDLHIGAYIQIGAMVILSLFVLSTFVRKQIVIPRSPLLLPLLLFYGWAMLSVLWTHTKYEALVDVLEWSGAFVSGLLILLILRNVKLLRILQFFLLISGVLMALLSIGQYLFGIDWVQQHIVPAATFSNKNMAGQYGVLIFPIAVVFFLHARDHLQIWLSALAITLMVIYIFYTRSRGTWVSFGIEIVVLTALLTYIRYKHNYHPLKDKPIKKIALAVSLVLFVGMAYLTPTMLGMGDKVVETSIGVKPDILRAEHGGQVVKNLSENFMSSREVRVTMWANSMAMFLDHFIIGVGLGNWTIHYPKYQAWFKQDQHVRHYQYHLNAHNDYVEILCELGIVGFMLFLWVIIALFKVIARVLSRHDKEYFLLTIAMVVALAGISVGAVFSFPFKQPVSIFLIIIYMAILSNLYSASAESQRDYVFLLPPLPVRAFIATAVILVTVGVFALQYNWYHSEIHYRNSVLANGKNNYQTARIEAEKAYELNPLRARLLAHRSNALMKLGNRSLYKEAAENLEEVERTHPYALTTMVNLASIYHRLGQNDKATSLLERMLSVQPEVPHLRFKYAVSLTNVGRYKEALEQFEGVVLPHRERRYEEAHALFTQTAEEKGSADAVRLSITTKLKVKGEELANIHKIIGKVRAEKERVEALLKSNP